MTPHLALCEYFAISHSGPWEICLILKMLLICSIDFSLNFSAPSYQKKYDGSYYKIYRKPEKWARAKEICKEDGAELSDDTPINHEIVRSYWERLWLDGSNEDRRKWQWSSSGMEIEKFYWRSENVREICFRCFWFCEIYSILGKVK